MASLEEATLCTMMLHLSISHPSDYCIFWKLPAEIRNVIYEQAYSRDTDKPVTVTTKRRQREKERKARLAGQKLIATPFLHYINRFLVNKRFKNETYAIFVAPTHFNFKRHCGIFESFPNQYIAESFSSITSFTASIADFCCGAADIAKSMPHLKSVTLMAYDSTFETFSDYSLQHENPEQLDIMLDTFTEDAALEQWLTVKAKPIKGLQSVEFRTPEANYSTAPQACHERCQENIKTIKAAIAKTLMREKIVEVVEETEEKIKALSMANVSGYSMIQEGDMTTYARAVRKLRTEDIPAGINDIKGMMRSDPEGMAEWVASACKRLKKTM